MRFVCASAAGLALAATVGCAATSTIARLPHPAGAAAPALAAASPRHGHGELAFIAYGRLYLRGGSAGAPRLVALPGIGYAPAWSADGRWLAVEVSSPPPASQPYLQMPAALWLVTAAGTGARRLTPPSWQVSGFAWAPYRGRLAVVAYLPQAPQTRSYLIAYWLDFQGSGSIAADGLPLDSVALGTRSSRTLVTAMLVHGSWLALAHRGRAFAAVSGGDRVIWSGGKQITLCVTTDPCTPLAQPAGVVSVDPSWSPGGTVIAYARLSASGPFGPNGHADFSPYWITRWEATSRLWIVAANGSGARPLAAAGPGAVDPVWGRDGSLLFVRNDSLWLLPADAAAPTRLTGPLGALSGPTYYRTYYGYVPYEQLFAWALS